MPRHKGRPPTRTVTIADCASLAIHDNPTPKCPHGLAWRESDFERITDLTVRAKMCAEADCVSNEYHPHEGECIVLRQPRSIGGRDPLRRVYASALAMEAGEPQPAGFLGDLIDAVVAAVDTWEWTGTDGRPLPLPRDDWETVADSLEYPELLWIVEATLRGADPREDFHRPPVAATGKDSASG